MNQIREHFNQFVLLSDKDWEIFSMKLTKQQFNKKSLVLKAGQTENYLSFIEKGIVRSFIPKEENDLTFAFAFANGFVSAYDSFITQEPSAYSLETLTETVLWRISYKDLQYIYAATEAGNTIGRYAAEDNFLKKSKRELSFLHESAEERYLNLLLNQPRLIKEIPLKYLASYIGITAQALSRIRKRIS